MALMQTADMSPGLMQEPVGDVRFRKTAPHRHRRHPIGLDLGRFLAGLEGCTTLVVLSRRPVELSSCW